MTEAALAALRTACRQVGIGSAGGEVIRAAENTLVRLPGGVVARVTREGQAAAARKEVAVSRWLITVGIPVVEALPDVEQPIEVAGRAVTFWRELPAHREGTAAEVAGVLRQLHALPLPSSFELPALAPFVRLAERIDTATSLEPDDRTWLRHRLRQLEHQYAHLPSGLGICAVHGDAWGGNIVATRHGPVLLDLERFAVGPPEWDLVAIAVDHFTFASLTADEWGQVCQHYGYDVTTWPGYQTLRDIRELRKVTFAAQMAVQYPHLRQQAQHRVACLRGHDPRPWYWQPVP